MISSARTVIVLILLVAFLKVSGQITIVPAPQEQEHPLPYGRVTETAENSTLFPFWDDFSTSPGQPDTARWLDVSGVWVNDGLGINKPSLNVASFDGVDRLGNIYSTDPLAVGYTDSLVSKQIDLTGIPAGFENTVYLSFYYQREGLGENPDDTDYIELQFRGPDSTWTTVWPEDPNQLIRESDVFESVILPVDPGVYFHPYFQFRFRCYGRRSGPFDTWHVDFVYLDKGRSADDNDFLDRAIMKQPGSIFSDYTAIPASRFLRMSQSDLRAITTDIFNYETSQFVQGIEYSAFLKNTDTSDTIDILADRIGRTILSLEQLSLEADAPDYALLRDAVGSDTSRLNLTVEYQVDTGDTLLIDTVDPIAGDTTYHNHVDLRVNDTVRRNFVIHDYYAYDDGSAEYGAGINQNGGQLVYEFIIDQPDTLVALDMYFTNIGRVLGGTPIEIVILSDLDEDPNSVIYSEIQSIQPAGGINQFGTYEIDPAIVVQDTFYIGFVQSNREFITLGLDKNTDTGSKIYYNISGSWEQNTDVTGSLMLRPRFGRNDIILSTPDWPEPEPTIKVWPNPADDRIYIEGKHQHVQVIDLSGREWPLRHTESYNETRLDTRTLVPGMYILQVMSTSGNISRKILIER